MVEKVAPLRRGENSLSHFGGNVSAELFPQALDLLRRNRGYETQTSLAEAMGKTSVNPVSLWLRGLKTPSPVEMGCLLVLFKPNDQELEMLMTPYGKLISEGKGYPGGVKGSEISRKLGAKSIKKSNNALGNWMEEFAEEKKVTLEEIYERIGFAYGSRRRARPS